MNSRRTLCDCQMNSGLFAEFTSLLQRNSSSQKRAESSLPNRMCPSLLFRDSEVTIGRHSQRNAIALERMLLSNSFSSSAFSLACSLPSLRMWLTARRVRVKLSTGTIAELPQTMSLWIVVTQARRWASSLPMCSSLVILQRKRKQLSSAGLLSLFSHFICGYILLYIVTACCRTGSAHCSESAVYPQHSAREASIIRGMPETARYPNPPMHYRSVAISVKTQRDSEDFCRNFGLLMCSMEKAVSLAKATAIRYLTTWQVPMTRSLLSSVDLNCLRIEVYSIAIQSALYRQASTREHNSSLRLESPFATFFAFYCGICTLRAKQFLKAVCPGKNFLTPSWPILKAQRVLASPS